MIGVDRIFCVSSSLARTFFFGCASFLKVVFRFWIFCFSWNGEIQKVKGRTAFFGGHILVFFVACVFVRRVLPIGFTHAVASQVAQVELTQLRRSPVAPCVSVVHQVARYGSATLHLYFSSSTRAHRARVAPSEKVSRRCAARRMNVSGARLTSGATLLSIAKAGNASCALRVRPAPLLANSAHPVLQRRHCKFELPCRRIGDKVVSGLFCSRRGARYFLAVVDVRFTQSPRRISCPRRFSLPLSAQDRCDFAKSSPDGFVF